MFQRLRPAVYGWWEQDNARQDAILAATLFLSAFAVFTFLAPHSFRNADMPVYAEQIINSDFSQRTTHIGYIFLGVPFAQLPIPLDLALNLMSAAFAAATAVIIYFLAIAVTDRRPVAWASALILLVNDAFLIEAVHAEVYMPQAFFAVASLLAWIRDRPVLTGCLFAVAFLISASSALFVVGYPFLRREPRAVLIAGLTTAAIVAAVLAPHLNNYFFGARGIFRAVGTDVNYPLAVLKNGRDIFFGFYLLVPFLIAGTITAIREASLRPFAFAVGLAWLATFAIGERFMDVPVQLPVYCLFAVLAGIGVVRIAEAGRIWILLSVGAAITVLAVVLFVPVPDRIADHLPSTALLIGFAAACLLAPLTLWKPAVTFAIAAFITAAVAYTRVIDTAAEADNFAEASREAFAKTGPNRLFVGHWNDLMRFNWNARRRTYTEDLDYSDDGRRIPSALKEGREILVLKREKPGDGYTMTRFGTLQAWVRKPGE